MKIGFTGAHSVGKTTLLNELKKDKQFKDYVFCSGISREIAAAGYEINRTKDITAQILIFNKILNNFMMHENIIADRTLFDAFAYFRANIRQEYNNIIFTEKQREQNTLLFDYFQDMIKTFIPKYDIIFYIPIEFKIFNDGIRDIDPIYREQIDLNIQQEINIIKEYYNIRQEKLKTRIVTIRGSVDERLEKIYNSIEFNKILNER